MKSLPDNSVDAVVTDPPYGLSQHSPADITAALTAWVGGKEYLLKKKGFMGKTWDSFVPGPELWRETLRVLKPGGHCLVFAGSRTDDLMGIALRMAGFEIRDKVMWLYGTGFPKSLNIGKALDKAAGAERTEVVGRYQPPGMDKPWNLSNAADDRTVEMFTSSRNNLDILAPVTDAAKQWDGWGTALKPAFEPIIVARKPLVGTVAANVLKHGTGGINIDACRVGFASEEDKAAAFPGGKLTSHGAGSLAGPGAAQEAERSDFAAERSQLGRWPANVIHDGSDEVEAAFAVYGETKSGAMKRDVEAYDGENVTSFLRGRSGPNNQHGDSGSVSRFFYSSKAGKTDRAGSSHPTVKPVSLMRYLVKLVTPPGGVVLDPFAGSGTTGQAALDEGLNAILMERETDYQKDIVRRFEAAAKDRTDVKFTSIAAAPAVVAVPALKVPASKAIVGDFYDDDED